LLLLPSARIPFLLILPLRPSVRQLFLYYFVALLLRNPIVPHCGLRKQQQSFLDVPSFCNYSLYKHLTSLFNQICWWFLQNRKIFKKIFTPFPTSTYKFSSLEKALLFRQKRAGPSNYRESVCSRNGNFCRGDANAFRLKLSGL
jgi:hypothetical protein